MTRAARRIAEIDRRWIVSTGVFIVAISIYSATLLHGVSSFDSAEMQTVPTVLGIAHPTGYPLWTLVGYLWTQLPFATPALLLNLLSALFFALAAATLSLIAMRLGVRPVLAAAAGLSFAFSGETWARATQAEVHSIHTFLVALLLLAWVIAEQTGSRRAALMMILVTSIGLTEHRLMEITGVPVLAWFFVRHLRMLCSKSFILDACLAGLVPLALYLYIPLRIHTGASVINADTSGGALPIIRGDEFASHEHAFTGASPGNWWHTLPTYGHLAVHWLGWAVVVFAIAGAVALLRRWPIAVGLGLIMLASTWGLANRTDIDYRWLIMPLFISCLAAANGLELSAHWLGRLAGAGARPLALAAAGALAIPAFALASHYSTYDRSGDRRDAVNGKQILAAVAPNAVIWSYWDLRTTLEYLTKVGHLRPDVLVLDHRAYMQYKSTDDGTVAADIASDPALTGRPYYFIPSSSQELAAVSSQIRLKPVLPVQIPYGFDFRGSGSLYLVER